MLLEHTPVLWYSEEKKKVPSGENTFYGYFVSLRQHKSNLHQYNIAAQVPLGKTQVEFEEQGYLNAFS